MNLPKVIFALVISIVVLYLCVMLVTVQNTLQEIQKGNENKETYVPAICNWEFGHYIQSEYEKMWFDNINNHSLLLCFFLSSLPLLLPSISF